MLDMFIKWFINLNGGEYIDFAMLSLTTLGGCFGLYQWYRSNCIKRAEYIGNLLEKLRTDKVFIEILYMFDYNEVWYNLDFHKGDNGLERKIDEVLSYFSYMCYLRKSRIINTNDFKFFNYEILRISQSECFCKYLYNLYHFSNKNNTIMSFHYLFEYCIKNEIIPKEIKQLNYYPKKYRYLNF
ncbi:MAG: hypothetical protein K0S47_461 [Herbinix sp.]|jgi:hypothetical protein|nr:hypothetical protein [Herbinix sp.]